MKPLLVEESAHRTRHLMTQAQPLLHHVSSQVEVAILESQLFVRHFVMMERRRFGAAQDLQFACQQLDLTRGEVGIRSAGGTRTYEASDANTEFAAQPLGIREDVLGVRIENDLQQPFPIAQIDKDHPAMIAPAMDPACDADFLADEGFVDLTAVVGAHGRTRTRRRSSGWRRRRG